MFKIRKIKRNFDLKELTNSILLVGLPGMGNVGKITVDYLIDKLKAEKICEVETDALPPIVYLNEQNKIELPKIELFFKKISTKESKKLKILFLAGDAQPTKEEALYEFARKINNFIENINAK